jgi:hypothetical protein
MAFLLLFLPYDEWIIKIFSLNIATGMTNVGVKDAVLSFIIWCLAYVAAVFIFDKLAFLLDSFPVVKKFGQMPFVRKIRDEINPASIFPVIEEE